MPKTTQTPKPEVDATLQPNGGIPVTEDGVAEVDISDGDDQAVVVDTAEEPKARNKKKTAKSPVGATHAAQNGPVAKSKKGSNPEKPSNTRRVRGRKTAKTPSGKKASATKGKKLPAETTLAQLAEAYILHLESVGKSHGTLASYGNELKLARAELGDETRVRNLTEEQVRAFFLSDRVTLKRSGQRKAEVGIAKTRRILRLALTWAQETGLIEEAPIPDLKSEGAAAAKATTTTKSEAKKTTKTTKKTTAKTKGK